MDSFLAHSVPSTIVRRFYLLFSLSIVKILKLLSRSKKETKSMKALPSVHTFQGLNLMHSKPL